MKLIEWTHVPAKKGTGQNPAAAIKIFGVIGSGEKKTIYGYDLEGFYVKWKDHAYNITCILILKPRISQCARHGYIM